MMYALEREVEYYDMPQVRRSCAKPQRSTTFPAIVDGDR